MKKNSCDVEQHERVTQNNMMSLSSYPVCLEADRRCDESEAFVFLSAGM